MCYKAATQKAFNRLPKECNKHRSRGERSCCGMHVGVNLRAVEVMGLRLQIGELEESSVGIDMVVHSACKLLGHFGNPEYGKGVHGFPEYLQTLVEEAETEEQLKACLKVRLEQ